MDLSQSEKLQGGVEDLIMVSAIDSNVYPVYSQQSVFSTLTTLANLCVMASVLLHGLPLLPPGRAWFKSVGYLPEFHPAVIGRGGGIKAKEGAV